MEKNVAGKWIVFAYGLPDHASPGEPITGDAANITANVRIDGGAANAVDDTNPTELEDGYYIFDLTATETNGDLLLLAPASSTADVQVIAVPGAVWTRPANFNEMGIESDGDLTKVNTLDGHTAQTADHTAGIADIPTVSEFNARTLVAADYFDPATDAVANVTLCATTTSLTNVINAASIVASVSGNVDGSVASLTGHTPQTGDSFARLGAPVGVSLSADIADIPTVAEFNARTLLAASYFDPAADTVANVTTVTNLTNLPSIPNNWITAAGIAASAMDDKGNWNINKTGYSLTQSFPSNFADMSITVTTGLLDVTQTAADKAWSTAARTVTAATNITSDGASINTTSGVIDTVNLVNTTTTNTDMRGTDGANTTTPPTATAIVDEWETQSQADPTGFHVNLMEANSDTAMATNLALQYNGTGLVGDNFPATQEQVGNISSASGGLSQIQDSFTNTDGGTETNDETATETLNGTSHIIDDNAGNTDFYYEFDIGVNGAATSILWNGYIQSNGDTAAPQMYNWGGAVFEDVDAPIAGTNGTTITEMSFPAPSKYTGTGANAGKVRFGFNSADATSIATDRVLCIYSSVAQEALVFASGIVQSGGTNTVQLAAGAVSSDDQFNRTRVIVSSPANVKQEAIVTQSVASTDTLTITPAWPIANPDSTYTYEVVPAQVHTTVRNGGYDNNNVYVDLTNGSAGTVKGVNGTSTNKSSNLADARTIADNETIRRFDIEGGTAFSLDQSYINWVFDHVSASFITLNSQDITGAVFLRSGITGVGITTAFCTFELCGLLDVTLGTCSMLSCPIGGTLTLADTVQYLASDCSSFDVETLIIDVNGDGITETGIRLSNFNGLIDLQNMTSVDKVVITGNAQVSINANCTGGTITFAGDIVITDNAGGAVTLVEGNICNILTDTAEIGVAGAGLTDLGGMATAMKAEVNAEILDVLTTDTFTEVGQESPAATQSLLKMIQFLYKGWRNKKDNDGSDTQLYADDGSTVDQKQSTSESGGTVTKGEWGTGP